MKYLMGALLLITLPGCMMLGMSGMGGMAGMRGMMNHGKSEETKTTTPSGEPAKQPPEQSTRPS